MNEISNNISFKSDENLINLINNSSSLIQNILLKAIKRIEVSEEEGVLLFKANDCQDKKAIFATARFLCRSVNESKVTFVINRNINFTNVCHMGCRFCNFAKRMKDKNAEWLSLEEIVYRAEEAWER